jgi:hypothetical protein
MEEDLQTSGPPGKKSLSMTPEAIRKRKERLEKRQKEEIEARGGESVEDTWARNSKQLLQDDPALHEKLQARHIYVVHGLEADVNELEKEIGLRSRPHTVGKTRLEIDETIDAENTFALDPCLAFKETKTDIQQNGTLNYREIESMRDGDAEDFRPAFGAKFGYMDSG